MKSMTIHGLHDKLIHREITAVELTEAYLAHKDKVEPKVQAFLSDQRENALQQAAAVDAKLSAGQEISMMAGIPGGV